MRIRQRPPRAGRWAGAGLAAIVVAGGLSAASAAGPASASSVPRFTALAGSTPATTSHRVGAYSSSRMAVEVSLAPSHEAGLASELRTAYASGSRGFHQWLRRGEFDARYAPAAAERAAVTRYLRSAGLTVDHSASPFLVRATGSS